MALVINKTPQEGYKFIPMNQREESEPFAVWVKPISSKELMLLEDGVVRREGEMVTLAAGVFSFKVLQKSLVAWEGITDADGTTLKIKRNADGTVSEESIGLIPAEMITEIANVVAAVSRNPANVQIFFPEDEEVTEVPKRKQKVVTAE